MSNSANDPLPSPEYVPFWQLSYFIGHRMMLVSNPDIHSTGLFATEESAQQYKLMEILKFPTNKYFIHQVNFPGNLIQL
jgi:hypothetical protein